MRAKGKEAHRSRSEGSKAPEGCRADPTWHSDPAQPGDLVPAFSGLVYVAVGKENSSGPLVWARHSMSQVGSLEEMPVRIGVGAGACCSLLKSFPPQPSHMPQFPSVLIPNHLTPIFEDLPCLGPELALRTHR